MGAVFVEELDEIPAEPARRWCSRRMACRSRCRRTPRRATCSISTPPVRWSRRYTAGDAPSCGSAAHVVLIGHAGHPEVIGTMGQLPEGAVTLIETEADAAGLRAAPIPRRSASSPRRRLSVDDTAGIIARAAASASRAITAPHTESICYATTNRQEAVKDSGAGLRSADRRRRAQFVQFGASGRSGASAPAPRCRFSCSAPPNSTGTDIEQHFDARPVRRRVGAGDHVDEIIDAFRHASMSPSSWPSRPPRRRIFRSCGFCAMSN